MTYIQISFQTDYMTFVNMIQQACLDVGLTNINNRIYNPTIETDGKYVVEMEDNNNVDFLLLRKSLSGLPISVLPVRSLTRILP